MKSAIGELPWKKTNRNTLPNNAGCCTQSNGMNRFYPATALQFVINGCEEAGFLSWNEAIISRKLKKKMKRGRKGVQK